MPPIDLEALAGRRLHPSEGAVGLQLRTDSVHILAQDAVSAFVIKRLQALLDNRRRCAGILFQPFGDGRFEGIELAFAIPLRAPVRRRVKVFF